jgi:cytochrome c6
VHLRKLVLAAAAALAAAGAAHAAAAQDLDGGHIFQQNCAACHQLKGQGVPGAFPALAGNTFVQGPPAPVAHVLLNGRGGMPNFRDDLSDAEIASVLTYVRGAWGNKAAPLDGKLVAAERTGKTAVDTSSAVLPYH